LPVINGQEMAATSQEMWFAYSIDIESSGFAGIVTAKYGDEAMR
jgi:hypothetical protein